MSLDLPDTRCLWQLLACPCLLRESSDSQRSIIWFRQIAQLSTTMSHAQSATAFHYFTVRDIQTEAIISWLTFLTSNLFLLSPAASAGPDFEAFATCLVLAGATGAASDI